MTVDAWMTEELTIVDASMTVGWTIVEWMTVDEWKIVEWMTVEVVGGEMTVTVPRRVDGVIVTVKSVTVLLQVHGAAAMIVGVTSVTGLVGDGVMTVIGRALGEGVIEMNTSVPREMGGALVIVETGNAKIVTVETVTLTASEESVTETVVIAMTVTVTGLAGGASAQMIAEVIEMDGEEEMNRVVTSGDGNRHPPVQKVGLFLDFFFLLFYFFVVIIISLSVDKDGKSVTPVMSASCDKSLAISTVIKRLRVANKFVQRILTDFTVLQCFLITISCSVRDIVVLHSDFCSVRRHFLVTISYPVQ